MILSFPRIWLIAACVVATASNAASQEKMRDVTITLSSSSLGVASPRVANEMGLFAKHGLAAKILPMDSGATALAAVIAKSADACMR